MSARLGLVLVALAAAGCSEDVRAQIVITVEAQQLVQEETASLEVIARGGPSTAEISETTAFEETTERPLTWPRVFSFAPEGGDASRALLFSAVARDVGGNVVGETRILRGYVAGRVLRVRLVLSDACRGIVCPQEPEPMRCENGACVPAGGDPDLPDGGVGDAGPPVPCTSASECDDGIFCNGVELCVGGTCARGAIPGCDDSVSCTDDRCTGAACDHVTNDTLCTAGEGGRCDPALDCQYSVCDAATCRPTIGCQTATCTPDGECVRTSLCGPTEMCCASACVPMGCDDGNLCTRDVCVDSAGCVHEPVTTACDDANPCTTGDVCAGRGSCQGTPRDCSDGNPCTLDSCDGAGMCVNAPGTDSCDDGNPCTTVDTCTGGFCRGTPMNCDDGVACTDDRCEGGTCMRSANDALCPGGRCDAALGCQFPTCNGTTCMTTGCEDAVCTGPDVCSRTPRCGPGFMCCGGGCVAAGCSDGNPCTTDTCGASGCSNVPNSDPCNDGNPCTTGDVCASGACQPGTPINCADGNPCTTDACVGGSCAYTARDTLPCDDGLFCTESDRCSGTTCMGTPRVCTSDLEACTEESCNEAMDTCQSVALDGLPCDDGNLCTDNDRCTRFGFCMSGGIVSCGPELTCCPSMGCTSLGCFE